MENTIAMPQSLVDQIVGEALMGAEIEMSLLMEAYLGGAKVSYAEANALEGQYFYDRALLRGNQMSGLRAAIRHWIVTGSWISSWTVGIGGEWGRQVFGGCRGGDIDAERVERIELPLRVAIHEAITARNRAARRPALEAWGRRNDFDFRRQLRLRLLREATAAAGEGDLARAARLREEQAAIV